MTSSIKSLFSVTGFAALLAVTAVPGDAHAKLAVRLSPDEVRAPLDSAPPLATTCTTTDGTRVWATGYLLRDWASGNIDEPQLTAPQLALSVDSEARTSSQGTSSQGTSTTYATSSTALSSVSTTTLITWDDPDDAPGVVVVRLRGADGLPRGEPILLEPGSARRFDDETLHVACMPDGGFLVTWSNLGDRCVHARTFDSDGRARGEANQSLACGYNGIEVDTQADANGVWVLADGRPLPSLTRLDPATAAPLESFELPATTRLLRRPRFAVDGQGHAVVAPTYRDDSPCFAGYKALALDLAGGEAADGLCVQSFPYSSFTGYRLDVRVTEPGRFLLSWESTHQGGRVGRRLDFADAVSSTTTTTVSSSTTTLPQGVPVFDEVQVLDASNENRTVLANGTARLAAASDGSWLASWRGSRRLRAPRPDDSPAMAVSFTNGASWQRRAPAVQAGAPYLPETKRVFADAGSGRLLLGLGGTIVAASSQDRGDTWTATKLTSPPPPRPGYNSDWKFFSAVAPEPGRWIVASGVVTTAAWQSFWGDSDSIPMHLEQIELARSSDGGVSWEPLPPMSWGGIDVHENTMQGGLLLAPRADEVLLAVAGHGRVELLRSRDFGDSWQPWATLPDGPVADDTRDGGSELLSSAVLPGGGIVLAWRAEGASGDDSDVLVSRSVDGGRSWTEPAPVADYAYDDAAWDGAPSLAVSPSGRLLLAWQSYYDGPAHWGMDADILVAVSDDGGATWSAPALLRPEMRDDVLGDSAVSDEGPRAEWPTEEVAAVLWEHEKLGIANGSTYARTELRLVRDARSCGDGAIDTGEECDDANDDDGDGCDHNCTLSVCGNGIVGGDEQCDDANSDDADDCLSSCRAASCGDGFLRFGVELCDDGNDDDGDSCTSACVPAVCGDGLVNRGVEDCDDANSNWLDDCLPDCRAARCGDGLPAAGLEQCDDGNDDDSDLCSNRCTFGPGCLPPGLRKPRASDALGVLRYAVGLEASCVLGDCDLDGDGQAAASDALMALRLAVGLGPNACPRGAGSFVIRIANETSLAALQLLIDYSAIKPFVLHNPQPGAKPCEALVPGAMLAVAEPAYYDHHLSVGIINLNSMDGPIDLIRCYVANRGSLRTDLMKVEIRDASDPNLEPAVPAPVVLLLPR